MLTKEQAVNATRFHYSLECTPVKQPTWRRNGRTKTWKTRPNSWVIPVKFGMYAYGHIDDSMASGWHTEEDCPNRRIPNA